MRSILKLTAMAAVFSGFALAGTWTGKLVDTSCMDQQSQSQKSQREKASMCSPSSSTTDFAIVVRGNLYKLDSAGDQKAQSALNNRAERSTNPNEPSDASVTAKVTGTLQGDTIQTQSLTIK